MPYSPGPGVSGTPYPPGSGTFAEVDDCPGAQRCGCDAGGSAGACVPGEAVGRGKIVVDPGYAVDPVHYRGFYQIHQRCQPAARTQSRSYVRCLIQHRYRPCAAAASCKRNVTRALQPGAPLRNLESPSLQPVYAHRPAAPVADRSWELAPVGARPGQRRPPSSGLQRLPSSAPRRMPPPRTRPPGRRLPRPAPTRLRPPVLPRRLIVTRLSPMLRRGLPPSRRAGQCDLAGPHGG
jgi:hypothetical protein